MPKAGCMMIITPPLEHEGELMEGKIIVVVFILLIAMEIMNEANR